MKFEVSNQMSHESPDTTSNFQAQEVPNEIFTEKESLCQGNDAVNQSGMMDDIMRHLNKDGGAMLNAFIAEVDWENFDIHNYIDPEFSLLLDEGMTNILHTIDSGKEGPECNLNMSVGAAAKSGNMVPVEKNIRKMLSGPVQPLKTSQLQPEIEQQLQKTNSQLQEKLNHLKQTNFQLQEELNRFKAIQTNPQQALEILEKKDLQQHPQVEQVSTVDKQKHEINVLGDINTVDNSVGLSSSGLTRTRRTRKPRRFFSETVQENALSNNEENIVLHSETIRTFAPTTKEQRKVIVQSNKRPATRNLRSTAKQSRRCSQVSVHMENKNNDDGIDNSHDEEDISVDRDEDDTNISLNRKSKKTLYRGNNNGFSKKDNVMENIRVSNGKRYVCDVKDCNSVFKSRNGLIFHKRAHAGLKPYSCNECNRRFGQKGDLSRHMMIHSGVKPYSCNECNRQFRHKQHLSRHMMIHSGEKPHLCKVCNKSFRQKNHLSDHLKVHTREKPHMCQVCNKSFRQKSHLSGHLKTCIGKNQLLFCDYCGKKFSKKTSLRSHCLKCWKIRRV